MAKRTKSKQPKPPRAELVAKWPELVAAWKAKLQEELPEPAYDLLKAMLNQGVAAQDNNKSPAMEALQKAKLEALRAYVARFERHLKLVQDRSLRMERLKGLGGWSEKKPNVRVVRAEGWLDGFHDGLLLFDILLFRKHRGGITDLALAALFGREAGASISWDTDSERKVKPGKWDDEIPKWRTCATEILTGNRHLRDRAVYICIAEKQIRARTREGLENFGHNVIRRNLPLGPIRQSLPAPQAHT